MSRRQREREENFLKRNQDFKTNGFLLLNKMVAMCNEIVLRYPDTTVSDGAKRLVDEIIYTIFFHGQILDPNGNLKFSPEEIIDDTEMLNMLKDVYGNPFQYFDTQPPELRPLPRRSPFSCVLDMVVLQKRQQNAGQTEDAIEVEIRNSLRDLVNDPLNPLNPKFLVSSTICVSQYNNSVKQYGVSVSTTGKYARIIAIGASCLSGYWNQNVADAVMTYYPDGAENPNFNGTFTLPKGVSCQAYDIAKENVMAPCKSCRDLFGLQGEDTKIYIYGNCAEAECLSNLLNSTALQITLRDPDSMENRENAVRAANEALKNTLTRVSFVRENPDYYTPQI